MRSKGTVMTWGALATLVTSAGVMADSTDQQPMVVTATRSGAEQQDSGR